MLKQMLTPLILVPLLSAAAQSSPPPANAQRYCQQLVQSVDLWNGGPDGQTGMGAYRQDFNGFFHVNLSRTWEQQRGNRITSVAQARAIYMNIEAFRATREQRFLRAALAGTDFLLDHFRDSTHGGFYWEVDDTGWVTSRNKQGYGNVFALFTLAQLYSVTHDPRHLEAARTQLKVLEKHFLDPRDMGLVLPGFNFDFSELDGHPNIDTFTHYFEALLALHDVLDGSEKDHVAGLTKEAGQALVEVLYQNKQGHTDQGYVAYNYDSKWSPAQAPYTRATQWTTARQASTGHNIELAYLLSRAVERGFDSSWLETARKLKRFVEVHSLNPQTGAMQFEITEYDGTPSPGNPDNALYVWWASSEAARAFLHFAVVHKDYSLAAFHKQENFIQNHFVDQEHGGGSRMWRSKPSRCPTRAKATSGPSITMKRCWQQKSCD
ncbi:AGE family epimerase/isomerase [Deinococcus cellulosilyticus]|uniref:N-acylglucosamine 2-epimerase n=1 Tax=Deinococcus cellulosilyticus (strain DSM 18568 / NBRC 106333 / KACC 11606 / 5516J-15) TaxID=1223518 RepID=A0A511N1H8_DEIC1|nr:AGE family epimerase/isomerase [Deinococcus cellulosilyticus]GEM46724.1 hypothetical protein DC3_23590 [Deinococcus cellulosilyticus NBRC 106333 = KACC 11606]